MEWWYPAIGDLTTGGAFPTSVGALQIEVGELTALRGPVRLKDVKAGCEILDFTSHASYVDLQETHFPLAILTPLRVMSSPHLWCLLWKEDESPKSSRQITYLLLIWSSFATRWMLTNLDSEPKRQKMVYQAKVKSMPAFSFQEEYCQETQSGQTFSHSPCNLTTGEIKDSGRPGVPGRAWTSEVNAGPVIKSWARHLISLNLKLYTFLMKNLNEF